MSDSPASTDAAPPSRRGRRLTTLGTLIAATLLCAAFWQLWHVVLHDAFLAVDDAYISFRYAENLRNGLGLRWNADSAPCEGYTNLLHVLVIAAGRVLSGATPELIAAWSACGAATLIAVLLFWQPGPHARFGLVTAIAPLGFVLDVNLHIHACRGLETVMFALLSLGTVASLGAVVRSHGESRTARIGAVSCTILAFLCRPDGVLLAGVAWLTALALLLQQRASLRSTCVALSAVIGAGLVYAAWKLTYFGSLFPTAFYMKGDVEGLAGTRETLAFVLEYWPLLAAALAGAITTRVIRGSRTPPEAILAMVITLAWLAYTSKILHEIGYSHRFVYPIVPVLWLAVAASLHTLAARLPPLGSLVVSIALVLALLGSNFNTLRHRHWQQNRDQPIDPYSETYSRLGRAIRDVDREENVTLLCSHAGATPFAAACRHIDSGGLTDCNLSRRADPADRAAYLASAGIDLCTSHLLPASQGATSPGDEPRWASEYLQTWHLGALPADMDASGRVERSRHTAAQNVKRVFSRMRNLRDNWTLLGEMKVRQKRWRVFDFAKRSSPHHDRLVRELTLRMDLQPTEIDWNGWPR